jgi:CRP-like cAMP-binding protein
MKTRVAMMQMNVATVSSTYPALAPYGGQPVSVPGNEISEDALDAIGTVMAVARGAELYSEGDAADSWYQVKSGVLRTCKLLPDGRRQIDAFLSPGDFLGFEGLPEHSFGAEAITSATVVRYSRARVERLAAENARLGARLLQVTLRRLSEAHEHLLLLGRKTAEEKIASFILEMLGSASDRDVIELPMSRSDIADYLGLTIETVSRTFSALKQDGVLALPSAHRIVVLDRAALEELNGDE